MNIFHRLLCAVIGTTLLLSACTEKKAPAPPPASQPEASHTMVANDAADDQALIAEVAAGGIPTSYVAHFDQDKLTRIDETRASNRGSGSYEFYGARLLKYSGAALDSAAPVLLEFSLTGSVEKSQSGDGPATPAQIDSIRTRGQLLRSHALAQRSTRSHSPY